jgi:hypothetical protein
MDFETEWSFTSTFLRVMYGKALPEEGGIGIDVTHKTAV